MGGKKAVWLLNQGGSHFSSCPPISTGDWFQDPRGYQNPRSLCPLVGPQYPGVLHSRIINTEVQDLWLAQSADAELADTESQL